MRPKSPLLSPFIVVSFVAAGALVGCGGSGGGGGDTDAAPDAAANADSSSGSDANVGADSTVPTDDGGTDGTVLPGDTGSDAGWDGGADAGSDGGTDAGWDSGTDAGSDGGTDAGWDGGTDAGWDSGTDAGSDGGTDAGWDSGTDAGSDSAADAGCTLGAQQCSGPAAVQTCIAGGGWADPVACPPGAPVCLDGACVLASPDGGLAMPPSCQTSGPGRSNCGSGDGGVESCCASLEVTGGTYDRTYVNDGDGGTGESDPASVSGFRLDKYEVTVGRFRAFVVDVLLPDGGLAWTPPPGSGVHGHLNGGNGLANGASPGTYEPGWVATDNVNIAPTNAHLACGYPFTTWTSAPGAEENRPINCANWYEAYAFCIWDGGFLPSESEWEYAAAGGSDQREFPWGDATSGAACSATTCEYAIDSCCSGNIAPVGTAALGGGAWGQLDLMGNLQEWNLDWYSLGYDNPCADCASTSESSSYPYRIFRGGAWGDARANFLVTYRYANPPAQRGATVGFRCARTP